MLFADLMDSLLGVLRARVRNGEITERGLARMVGVSQPHIHNVLKGARALSPELSDQILQHLRLSALDLVDPDVLERRLNTKVLGTYDYVPLLRGCLGPNHPWPTEISDTRLPFPTAQTAGITKPVAVRLAEDVRMASAFVEGDIALLDQSLRARTDIDPLGRYVVRFARGGVVRRLHISGSTLFLIADDTLSRPSSWQRVSLEGRTLSQLVRARAYLTNPMEEWS